MLDQDQKKRALRQFTYGLYAVTAEHDGERGVFTANWLSQASFDPPMLMMSVENESATLRLIRESGRFAVCPFADGQRELAGNLGRPRARVGDKFASFNLTVDATRSGVPVLVDTLGAVVCQLASETPAGDSVVLIGQVIEARVFRDDEPLTMGAAGFRHAG